MASSPLAQYESFLISNASTISTIESSLRSLTWFLPGRFRDAELASEASYTMIPYSHDGWSSIQSASQFFLPRRIRDIPERGPSAMQDTAGQRVSSRWCDLWSSYWRWVPGESLPNEQCGREYSHLKGSRPHSRLFLLKLTRRPVLLPPIPEREIDPATMSLDPLSDPVESSAPPRTPDHIKNNRALPSPLLTPPKNGAKPMPIEDYLMSKALSTDDLRAPTRLMDILASPRDWVAEVLFITRPLIYVYLLSRSTKNKSRPFAVSFAIELLARNLRRVPVPSAHLERTEYARRDRDLLWYALRGVAWSDWTRPRLDAIAKKTQDAPLLNLLSAFIGDWVPLIDEYYYYTAT